MATPPIAAMGSEVAVGGDAIVSGGMIGAGDAIVCGGSAPDNVVVDGQSYVPVLPPGS